VGHSRNDQKGEEEKKYSRKGRKHKTDKKNRTKKKFVA
jgi:hypothetical protein